MKILHINCNYTGTTLHQLMIEKMDERGTINEVVVPVYFHASSSIIPNDNVNVIECFYKNDRFLFDMKQRKIIKAIEKLYDISSFDLIHAYTLFTDGNTARILSEKYGVPYVVTVRNTDVNIFFKKMIFLRNRGVQTLKCAKQVFFLSSSYCDQVINTYVLEKDRLPIISHTSIVPNGIDPFWINNINHHERELRKHSIINLIYAGVIDKNKNIISTQMAMGILREKGIDCKLHVVGKSKDKQVYSKVEKDNNTVISQPVDKEKLIDYYREADIFVMPSHTETFGLVYAEAMSQGLPVLYTKGQGFDNQFEEGYVGYHVDDKAPENIAEAICKIRDNYSCLSKNAVKACRKFSWEEIVDKYISIYKEIIS